MSWYETVAGNELYQGDVLRDCPIFVATAREEDGEVEGRLATLDIVVITQTCDLVNDKVDDILLARVVDWETMARTEYEAGNTIVRDKRFLSSLVAGNVPHLSLLHKHMDEPTLAWSVVNFHQLYTSAKSLVRDHAAGADARLRLSPPYREHLAQAFARYFMRVGLPHDAKAFVDEGRIAV